VVIIVVAPLVLFDVEPLCDVVCEPLEIPEVVGATTEVALGTNACGATYTVSTYGTARTGTESMSSCMPVNCACAKNGTAYKKNPKSTLFFISVFYHAF
jgi:hypothetical protein